MNILAEEIKKEQNQVMADLNIDSFLHNSETLRSSVFAAISFSIERSITYNLSQIKNIPLNIKPVIFDAYSCHLKKPHSIVM